MQAYLTIEEVGIAAAFLGGIIKRYVPDTKLLRQAADELSPVLRYLASRNTGAGIGGPTTAQETDPEREWRG